MIYITKINETLIPTAFSKYIPGITFIDKITTIEDVTLVPG